MQNRQLAEQAQRGQAGFGASEKGGFAVLKTKLWALLGVSIALAARVGALHAQAAAQTTAQSAEAAADATSASAMARAQRAASNPMRVILEASKIKRRLPESDTADANAAAAEAARKAATRVVVATPATSATPAMPIANTRPAVVVAAISPASNVGAPGVVAAPLPTPAASTTSAVPQAPVVLPDAPLPAPAPASAQAPATLPAPSPAMAAPAAAFTSPGPAVDAAVQPSPALALPAAKPRMLTMVTPDIPARVRMQAGRIGEVLVELNLRRDGSVAAATVLPPASRLIQRYVVEALEKWRYEPMAQDAVHRVQLVFDDEP